MKEKILKVLKMYTSEIVDITIFIVLLFINYWMSAGYLLYYLVHKIRISILLKKASKDKASDKKDNSKIKKVNIKNTKKQPSKIKS